MPHRGPSRLILLAGCVLAMPSLRAADAPAPPIDVQTILDHNCVKCHGPLDAKAELRLDTAAGLWKGSTEGAVIVAGKPAESKLILALAAAADPHMPPKKQLGDVEIAKLTNWVTTTAKAPAPAVKSATPIVPADPVAAIDHFLAEGWRTRNLTPAPLCDDRTFLRRVMLDVIGRIPTPDEAIAFLSDATPDKRTTLVDKLLATDEAARNFREIWDVLLMGRGGSRREDRRRESGWFVFLENAYKQKRPWHEVVRTFITARPERPEDKGAIWFLFERKNDYQQMAEAVAPVIYGTRVDCAQCHDHPLASEIKKGHYWGLVAAFNRSKNSEGGKPAVKETASGGFMNFTNLKKESQPATIMMLTGRVIEEPKMKADDDAPDRYFDAKADVKVPKFSRRGSLAEAATKDNPLLARSFVNHTWALLMGRGIVDPPDEMNSKHPASHPELLDWLAADFAKNKYDVRRVMRSIVLSRGYQLASRSGPIAPSPEAFAAALERPVTAEAIARSMRIASGRAPDDDALRLAVIERFPNVIPRATRATIQQAMFLANSELVAGLFEPTVGRIIDANELKPEDIVRNAFHAALIREPDAEELTRGVAFLKANSKPSAASGQLLWALVTGPEFLTNH